MPKSRVSSGVNTATGTGARGRAPGEDLDPGDCAAAAPPEHGNFVDGVVETTAASSA